MSKKSVAFSEFTSLSASDTISRLGTDATYGLSNEEAKVRLKKYGKNIISHLTTSWYQIFFRQLKSPFIYLLIVASSLALLLGQTTDALFILLFITINTLLGFYQEFRSEETAKLLKSFTAPTVDVIREGQKISIKSEELVPGDIILFMPGDIVQGDTRLISQNALIADESALTGEAEATHKTEEALTKPTKRVFKAANILFAGTTIVSGSAKGVVIATAKEKVISTVTKLATEASRESTFEKGIGEFSKFILKMIGATLVVIFAANIILKGQNADIPELMLFTIALAVSVIPEALPLVTTFSLSRGALHLSKNKVVVKRLSAIEDLGSVNVICTDKTGTITENQMTLVDSVDISNGSLVKYAALTSNFEELKNKKTNLNSFDAAILEKVDKTLGKELVEYKKINEIPFDPTRRIASSLIADDKFTKLVARGSPENIFTICERIKNRKKLEKWIQKQGEDGKRVLAVAQKDAGRNLKNLKGEEKGMKLVGLLSFKDPLKKTAGPAIKKAKLLGIQIKILTGDRADVAGAVGTQVGLIESPDQVINGEDFEKLSSDKKLKAVNDYSIFARVSPEQKYEIIKLLQKDNEVGFLGEGINDAPALKIANVGIAVNDASDIAKESSDIILLHKSLYTIINGIGEGRSVFANTVKYIKATLASNFGNFYAVATASLLINYLPLLPLQILLVNLLSDFPMVTIATDNVEQDELKRPRTYEIKEIAFTATTLGLVSSGFDFLTFAVFVPLAPAVLQTNWFIESILTELLLIYSIRTKGPMIKNIFKNGPSKEIVILTAVAGAITIVLPFTAFGQKAFEFIRPSNTQFILVIAISLSYLVATEAMKLLLYRYYKPLKNS